MDRVEFPLVLQINGRNQACRVREAATAWSRLRGLLFLPPLRADQALWIHPCNSIHMLGMRYAIDAIFLDRAGRAIKVCKGVRPMAGAVCWRANSVLELTSGASDKWGIELGVQVTMAMA